MDTAGQEPTGVRTHRARVAPAGRNYSIRVNVRSSAWGSLMAIWRITIGKSLVSAGRNWVNRYLAEVADGSAAQTVANAIVAAERQFHHESVLFTNARVDDNIPNTDIYDTFAINQFGTLSSTAELMPLFVVLRVAFNTEGSGRPSMKYYRGCLLENNVNGMTVASAEITAVQGILNPLITAQPLVDVDGQAWVNAEPSPVTGMRQLRRGSKKKITP